MSYMGNYVMWLEEEGLSGMDHVERYHKENPHMIPPEGERVISTFPKDKEKIVRENIQSIAKAAEVLGWNNEDK